MDHVPIIDCTPLTKSFSSSEARATVSQIHSAFSTWGVFILTGTNPIQPSLTNSLRAALERFFSLPEQRKELLHLQKGGWAWRGYMPWGGEGTKGSTDQKEGFYGGPELKSTDEHSLKGLPTYGENQFPDEDVPEMRELVLEYIEKVTELGLMISDAMSLGLGFDKGEIRRRFLEPEPIQLFRSFKYSGREGLDSCGIGEHSDFGFLTILSQNAPGLQVLSPSGKWVDVPVIPDSFVVNGKSNICCKLLALTTNLDVRQSVIFSIVSLLVSTFLLFIVSCLRSPTLIDSPSHSISTRLGQLK